jgi:hypothetical protein
MISAAGFFHHTPSVWMKGPVLSLGHFKRALRDNFWQAPKDPNFVIVRLPGKNAIDRPQRTAAAELHTGELIVSKTPALDVRGHYYVAEPRRGWVGLYERGKGLQATIDLHKK